MAENMWLLGFLTIGIIVLSLLHAEKGEDSVSFINDDWLRMRMSALNIANWQQLRKQSGLEAASLRHIRRGEIQKINLPEIDKLAHLLNYQPEEFLKKLSAIAPINPNIEDLTILRKECERLKNQLEQQRELLTQEIQESFFGELQTLLTNYPSLRKMVENKSDLSARNIIALLTPLDNLLRSWHYEPIGRVWEQVEYDPELHQIDSGDIEPGEKVYIRFVGYRESDRVITPARVSRNLPAGIN